MSNIIFDFDGTIADSFELSVEIFHEIMGRENHLTKQEIDALRGLPAREVIKEVGVRWWRLPGLITRARRMMHSRLEDVHPFMEMTPVLRKLHSQNHRLFVLTSNSARNVGQFMDVNNLSGCFEKVYGNAGLFNKSSKLRKILQEKHLDINDCWYITDEVRDIIAAHHAKMRCVAVSWGFNSAAALRSANPELLIKKPVQLLDVANKSGV